MKRFSLDSLLENEKTNNIQNLINYVKDCMKICKLGPSEIEEYESMARSGDYTYCIQISQEYIDMLNNLNNTNNCKVTYL